MTQAEPITNDDLRTALLAVLDYLWQEEHDHFLMNAPEDQADHIFGALQTLAQWLRQTEHPDGD
jgi:hypothetical protein